MDVNVFGLPGFGDLPSEAFAELIRSRVEDTAGQGLRSMRKDANTLPQYHLEERASFEIDMEKERLTQFETDANPFIGIFHMKGRAVVDAKLPISADEGLLMVQRRLAREIAERVAGLAEDSDADQPST